MEFCCNIFHGCNHAREDASTKLPDVIHKLWFIVNSNPKSDMLICTIQMLVSLTSDCPSGKYYFNFICQNIFMIRHLIRYILTTHLFYLKILFDLSNSYYKTMHFSLLLKYLKVKKKKRKIVFKTKSMYYDVLFQNF